MCRLPICASQVVCSTMCSVPLAHLYLYPNPNEGVNTQRHRKQNADCSTNGRTHQILPIDVLEAVLNSQLPHAWIWLALAKFNPIVIHVPLFSKADGAIFLGRVEDSDWDGDSKHSCCRCKTQDCVLDKLRFTGNEWNKWKNSFF